jgi:excisionase family DNA binding protein
MTSVGQEPTELDTLLSVEQAAERLGTTPRFVRRLVFERRIAYVKLGRHVRIASRDLDAFIAAGRVDVGELPSLRRGPDGGPIEKRTRGGRVSYRARYRAPDGTERNKTFRRKVDADKFVATVESAKLRGAWTDPAAGRTTLAAWLEEWWGARPTCAPRRWPG